MANEETLASFDRLMYNSFSVGGRAIERASLQARASCSGCKA